MLYKKILFIIFYLLLFASYSFASNISEYKDEVSSYAKKQMLLINLKMENIIFKNSWNAGKNNWTTHWAYINN